MADIKQIKVGSTTYDVHAIMSDKLAMRFRKSSEASTAVGYYKIATLTHYNWNYCAFTMLVNNSYSGTLYNTIFDVRCADNNNTLNNFAFHIIGGDDISSKLAYLETKSGDNTTKIEIFLRCSRYEHPGVYLIAVDDNGNSNMLSINSSNWGDTPDKADSTTMTGNATNTIVASNALKLNGQNAAYYLNYNNFTNTPTIPAAQVNADWNATSGVASIKNKPAIPSTYTDVGALSSGTNYTSKIKIGTASTEYAPTNGVITLPAYPTDTHYTSTWSVYAKVDSTATCISTFNQSAHRSITFNAGGGINLTGTANSGTMTIAHANTSITAQNTQAVYPIKIDAYGHITSYGTAVTIPAAQVNADWNATSGLSSILNKPLIPSDTHYTSTFTIYGDSTSVAQFTQSANMTLSIVGGDNITLTKDATNHKITISGTANTWNANAVGVAGYVAAPTAAANKNSVWKTDANGNPAWRADTLTTDYYAGSLKISTTSFSNGTQYLQSLYGYNNSLSINGSYIYIGNSTSTFSINIGGTMVGGTLFPYAEKIYALATNEIVLMTKSGQYSAKIEFSSDTLSVTGTLSVVSPSVFFSGYYTNVQVATFSMSLGYVGEFKVNGAPVVTGCEHNMYIGLSYSIRGTLRYLTNLGYSFDNGLTYNLGYFCSQLFSDGYSAANKFLPVTMLSGSNYMITGLYATSYKSGNIQYYSLYYNYIRVATTTYTSTTGTLAAGSITIASKFSTVTDFVRRYQF